MQLGWGQMLIGRVEISNQGVIARLKEGLPLGLGELTQLVELLAQITQVSARDRCLRFFKAHLIAALIVGDITRAGVIDVA